MAEQVLDIVNTNATNMDASSRAALRVVSKECTRFVSENTMKLTYEVRSS